MLQTTTVKKGFESIGFIQEPDHPTCMTLHTNHVGGRIHAYIDNPHIKLNDARWHKASNVHIVSYWHWPRNKTELSLTLKSILETYKELCQSF
jgi:hypothetical protein